MPINNNNYKILHIDSDKEQLNKLQKAFKDINPQIEVESHDNPMKAQKILNSKEYDCIISELYFPLYPRINLVNEFIKNQIPIIIYTNHCSDEQAEELFNLGVTDIYTKGDCPAAYRVLSNKVKFTVDKKRIEKNLRLSNARWKTIFENAPDTILTLNLKGVVTSVNPRIEEITGFSRDHFLGKHFTQLSSLRPQDFPHYISMLKSIIQGEIPSPKEYRYKKKDGSQGWGEANLVFITTDNGERELLVIAREISERKKVENKLRDSKHELEQIVKERTQKLLDSERLAAAGRIAGMIAHDVRGPLQNIKAGLFLLNQNPGDTDAFRMIDKASDLVSRLLEEIRESTTETPLMFIPTDLGSTLESTVNSFMFSENIVIHKDIQSNIFLLLDLNRTKRMIEHLLLNAVEAMPHGGTLTVRLHKKEDQALIQITDNGVGIRDEDKHKLFKAFNTTKSNGMGLGLVFCKQTAEVHNGSIHVESEQGKGTTVTICLPCSPPDALDKRDLKIIL